MELCDMVGKSKSFRISGQSPDSRPEHINAIIGWGGILISLTRGSGRCSLPPNSQCLLLYKVAPKFAIPSHFLSPQNRKFGGITVYGKHIKQCNGKESTNLHKFDNCVSEKKSLNANRSFQFRP